MFKVNNIKRWKKVQYMSEVNKLTIKTPERRQWRCSVVFILNFEHIPHLSVAFRLLLWTSWCLLGILRNTKQKKVNKSNWKLAKWNKKWNKKTWKKDVPFPFCYPCFLVLYETLIARSNAFPSWKLNRCWDGHQYYTQNSKILHVLYF